MTQIPPNEANTIGGDAIQTRGQAIYEERLKSVLEPAHNGQSVAIHLDTGDYVVDRNWSRAIRKLRETHKEGFVYSLFIGPPTNAEFLLGSKLSAGKAA